MSDCAPALARSGDGPGSRRGVLMVDGSDCPKQGIHAWGEASVLRRTGQASQLPAGVFWAMSAQGYTLLDRRLSVPVSGSPTTRMRTARQCGMPPTSPSKPSPSWPRR